MFVLAVDILTVVRQRAARENAALCQLQLIGRIACTECKMSVTMVCVCTYVCSQLATRMMKFTYLYLSAGNVGGLLGSVLGSVSPIDMIIHECVCLLVISMSYASTDEPMEISFGVWTWVRPVNHVLDGARITPWEGAIFLD